MDLRILFDHAGISTNMSAEVTLAIAELSA